MGFRLRCAVTRVDDEATAARVIAAARSLPHLAAQPLREPFLGVAAAFDPDQLFERLTEDPAAHGWTDEDAASEGAYEIIERAFDPLISTFPDHQFAIIDADCFGGVCRYHGHTRGPEPSVVAPDSSRAHQDLLAAIGAVDPPWYFAPFTRGFFDHGTAPDGPRRRPTICYVAGTLTGITMSLATACALQLDAPWKLIGAGDRHAIVGLGQDLHLSLNLVADDALDLKVASHVDAETTAARISELVEELHGATAELTLSDADHRPLRTWRIDP
jgi:hypothetical protein